MKKLLDSIAASAGISPESLLHIANGVANMIEADQSAQCYMDASEEDQTKIAAAYLAHYGKVTQTLAIKHHMNPQALTAYVYARVTA
jgi:hypothetical protein